MKFGFSAGCGAMLAAALLSQGVAAQSLRDWDSNADNDVRASAAITIPLGASPRSSASKPRLEFSFETQRMDEPGSVTPLRFDSGFERQTLHTARFAFTLEQNPRLLFSDTRIATFGSKLTADEDNDSGGGSVAGGILLGLGAAIGAGFLIGAIVQDDIEDAVRDDD